MRPLYIIIAAVLAASACWYVLRAREPSGATFPTKVLTPLTAEVHALLMEDQSGKVDLLYGIDLRLGPARLLGEDETSSRTVSVSHMPLNGAKDWRKIGGTYTYADDTLRGAIRIGTEWHPVDCRKIQLSYLGSGRFSVVCDLHLALEVWGSGYQDTEATLTFEAAFSGLGFQTQQFGPGSGVDDLEAFTSRYVDRSAYSEIRVEHETIVNVLPSKDG